MRIEYVPKTFRGDSLQIIQRANSICDSYRRQGYDLTLRQVYYQFVARGWLPNKQQSYKRLGSIVNDARLAGAMDWNSIVDRTRYLRGHGGMTGPQEAMEGMAAAFTRRLWAETDQPFRPEVWVEKDALVGVVERACEEYRVPFMSCRGYVSQSEMWAAGMRMAGHRRRGRTPVVIHLGDHDPSGIDMTRDIQDRLSMFAEESIEVRRIALNMDQIEQYEPPPNPAKLTDSRGSAYVAEYGDDSWELDALEPSVLVALIEQALEPLIDLDEWRAGLEREQAERSRMETLAARWDDLDERWSEIEDLLDE